MEPTVPSFSKICTNRSLPSDQQFDTSNAPSKHIDAHHCLVVTVQHPRIWTPLTNRRNNSLDTSPSSTLTVSTQQPNHLQSPNFIPTSCYCGLYFERLFCVPASSAPVETISSLSDVGTPSTHVQCYASAALPVMRCLSVRLSVRLSVYHVRTF